ncbi:MAG: hypothetical protein HKL82_11065 [Acidimicrobiaceae bacterium]|nr:hypothetical protein [Acidimicrobiaceae bacterium]
MALDLMERDLSDGYSELTPLKAEELDMDGAGGWSEIFGGVIAIGAISTADNPNDAEVPELDVLSSRKAKTQRCASSGAHLKVVG